MNNICFTVVQWAYLEFFVDSFENIYVQNESHVDFTKTNLKYDNINNLNIDYSNDTFTQDVQLMENFVDNLQGVIPIDAIQSHEIVREGMNIFYKLLFERIKFNASDNYKASNSLHQIIRRNDEIQMCNQLKSVILAESLKKC